MVTLFGVQRSGLSLGVVAARVVWCASCAAIAGCDGEGLLVGEERPRPAGAAGQPDGPGTINGPTPPDVAILEDCPATPGERQGLLGCWPTPHLGAWRGFFTGIPRYETPDGAGAEFPTGDVLLRLGVDGAGQLTFGVPPAISSAALEAGASSCDAPDPPPGCDLPGRLIPGFAYRLEEIALYDRVFEPETRIQGEPPFERPESMDFEVRVGQPWDGWCSARGPQGAAPPRCLAGECEKSERPARAATVDSALGAGVPGCQCDDAGCRPAGAALFIALSMSSDQESLRGSYRPGEANFGTARLEFRKDPAP